MLEPEKTVVIANPAAGHGFIGNNWPTLGAKIQEVLGPVGLRLTESVGHATEIARDAAVRGARTIVSFGGDGTHSEIVDGIMQSGKNRELALGILHAGTGGDFRRMIDGADELERGCTVIRDREPVPIDIGWVEYARDEGGRASRYFVNITSMGMSGLVDRYVAASKSRRSGKAKYFMATLRAQLEYKPARIRLRVDGRDQGEHEVSVVCVCNGRWAGGGMMFAPNARLTDGEFDIIVIRATSTLRGLPVMAGLYKGTHIESSTVSTFRGKHIEVDVMQHIAYMDIDGEAPGTGPAEFRIHEGALGVIGIAQEFR